MQEAPDERQAQTVHGEMMENAQAQSPTARETGLSFLAPVLGFAFMLASNLMSIKGFDLAHASITLTSDGLLFSRLVLMAFLGGGLLCFATCSLASVHKLPNELSQKTLFYLGVSVSVPGFFCVFAIDLFPQVPPVLGVFSGFFIGVGNALLLILWGRVYGSLSLKRILVYASLAFAIGVSLSVLTLMLLNNRGQVYLWSLCQVATCILLALSMPTRPERSHEARAVLRGRYKGGSAYLWMTFGGLGILALIFGIYWGHNLSMVLYDSVVEVLVSWVAAGLLLAFALLAKKPVRFKALYRIALPTASVLLLINPFISLIDVGINLTSAVFFASCFVIFGVVNWTVLSDFAATRRVPTDPLFSVNQAVWCLAFFSGILLSSVFDSAQLRTISTVVVVVFIILSIISYVMSESDRKEETMMDERVLTERKAQRIIEGHGLSKREGEVLVYLMAGRGARAISEKLHISASTVETHRKHIYEKLEVSSREELLDLADRA